MGEIESLNADGDCVIASLLANTSINVTFTLAQAVRLLTTIPAYYDFLQAAFSAATGNVAVTHP